jgi:hypothetical protein
MTKRHSTADQEIPAPPAVGGSRTLEELEQLARDTAANGGIPQLGEPVPSVGHMEAANLPPHGPTPEEQPAEASATEKGSE